MERSTSGEIVIGILTKNCNKGQLLKDFPDLKGTPCVATSYQDFVKSTGAKPFIIDCDLNEENARNIYESIHGLILPGGNACLKTSNYQRLASLFCKWSAEDCDNSTRYFPILGICLGHQFLLKVYENENINCLTVTNTKDVNIPLEFNSDDPNEGRLFHTGMSDEIRRYFTEENITFNFHNFSIVPKDFIEHEKIKQTFRVLATSRDPTTNTTFIAAIEGIKYPFYGLQWHPEKNAYETDPLICHTEHSIQCSQYIIDFFAQECKKDMDKVTKDYQSYTVKLEARNTILMKKRRQILMVVKN